MRINQLKKDNIMTLERKDTVIDRWIGNVRPEDKISAK